MRQIFEAVAAEYRYHQERACPRWYAFPVFVLCTLAGAGAVALGIALFRLPGPVLGFPNSWSAIGAIASLLLALVCAFRAIGRYRTLEARRIRERLEQLEGPEVEP